MDDELGQLAEAVEDATKAVRKLEKELPERAKSLGSSDAELAMATALCKAVGTGGKTCGDPILNPTALKRFERLYGGEDDRESHRHEGRGC